VKRSIPHQNPSLLAARLRRADNDAGVRRRRILVSDSRHPSQTDLGDAARWRYAEFFTANINNDHRRRAYTRACRRFQLV
jgi:hypothetical protein